MKNIHIVPTDKISFGKYPVINKEGKLCIWNTNTMGSQKTLSAQHIYITSDEQAKEGDWVYYENGDLKGIHKVVNGQRPKTMILKKIILTTDQDLIKDSVQAIDDEFLEWFVKNPSCEKVEIKKQLVGKLITPEHYGVKHYTSGYKIIISKEENQCWDCKGIISKDGTCFCNREEIK